jgi:hypothetical protein
MHVRVLDRFHVHYDLIWIHYHRVSWRETFDPTINVEKYIIVARSSTELKPDSMANAIATIDPNKENKPFKHHIHGIDSANVFFTRDMPKGKGMPTSNPRGKRNINVIMPRINNVDPKNVLNRTGKRKMYRSIMAPISIGMFIAR